MSKGATSGGQGGVPHTLRRKEKGSAGTERKRKRSAIDVAVAAGVALQGVECPPEVGGLVSSRRGAAREHAGNSLPTHTFRTH